MAKLSIRNDTKQVFSMSGGKGVFVVLKPGLNEVDAEAWEHAKKNGEVKARIDNKTFVEVAPSSAPAKKKPS